MLSYLIFSTFGSEELYKAISRLYSKPSSCQSRKSLLQVLIDMGAKKMQRSISDGMSLAIANIGK